MNAGPPRAKTEPPQLFYDRGCPFAHRVLALAYHLGIALARRESALGHTPPGLGRYSRSSRVPLLSQGTLVLTESRVMLEYLAERHRLQGAFPSPLASRTLHRHAMAVVDDYLAGLFPRPDDEVQAPRLSDALDAVEAATATGAPRPNLLVFHVAPIWLRFRWFRPNGALTRAIEARPALCRWLDAALALPCIAHTTPDRAQQMEEVARACALGLLPDICAEIDHQPE